MRLPILQRTAQWTMAAVAVVGVSLGLFLSGFYSGHSHVELPAKDKHTTQESEPNLSLARLIVKDLGLTKVRTAHLLVFKVAEDKTDRFRHERALIAVELFDGKWVIASVYRHPQDAADDKWRMNDLHEHAGRGAQGDRTFNKRPSAAEICEFLRDIKWNMITYKYQSLIVGEVYVETWERVLGWKPPPEFQRFEIEPDTPSPD